METEINMGKIINLLLTKLKYIVLIALVFAIATFGYKNVCKRNIHFHIQISCDYGRNNQ